MREREFARERALGRQVKDDRRDFRDSLFSIFVDNLNPQVDVKGLWGIFKVFGKVRDIFLSLRSSLRKSAFAFIRFASVEEAQRVAKLTNGMHVYSWPIRTKVADYGWSKRRSEVPKGPGLKLRGDRSRDVKETFSNYRPVLRDNFSFVDAVKKTRPVEQRAESKEKRKSTKVKCSFKILNTYPVWENGGLGPDFGDKALKSSDIGKTDKGVRVQQEMEGDVSLKHVYRGGVNRNVNSCVTEKVGKTGHSDSFSKKEKGKGKLQPFRKPIVRPTEQENRKAKVILEKKRSGCQNSGYECDTSSSSSDDEDDFWKDVRSGYVVGDCSRKLGPYRVRGKGGPDDGTLEIHDDRLIDGPLPLGTDSRAAQFWIDIGPKETSSEKSEAGDVEALTGSEGGTWVEETMFLDPNIGDPVVKICQGPKSGANEDCQIEEPQAEAEKNYNEEGQIGKAEVGTTVSKKRREKVSSSRTHGMKTRYSKRSQKGEDNNIQIQEEVHVSRSEGWELENEVAKVIETAIALGLDIEGREEEIRKVVARRELEDEALYAK
ncbi:hypothetical protein LWI29_035805 [Acer saccharum]|uniref:RRM domain-containing protein n=1 Tax=Acer saccharum TaxID=4024 RepID=A0AA39VHK7_ACESA|nr:hypothetical protein LWI29_035805 [Acer saccharum]